MIPKKTKGNTFVYGSLMNTINVAFYNFLTTRAKSPLFFY